MATTYYVCGGCGCTIPTTDRAALDQTEVARCPRRCGYMYIRCQRCEAHPREALALHERRCAKIPAPTGA